MCHHCQIQQDITRSVSCYLFRSVVSCWMVRDFVIGELIDTVSSKNREGLQAGQGNARKASVPNQYNEAARRSLVTVRLCLGDAGLTRGATVQAKTDVRPRWSEDQVKLHHDPAPNSQPRYHSQRYADEEYTVFDRRKEGENPDTKGTLRRRRELRMLMRHRFRGQQYLSHIFQEWKTCYLDIRRRCCSWISRHLASKEEWCVSGLVSTIFPTIQVHQHVFLLFKVVLLFESGCGREIDVFLLL